MLTHINFEKSNKNRKESRQRVNRVLVELLNELAELITVPFLLEFPELVGFVVELDEELPLLVDEVFGTTVEVVGFTVEVVGVMTVPLFELVPLLVLVLFPLLGLMTVPLLVFVLFPELLPPFDEDDAEVALVPTVKFIDTLAFPFIVTVMEESNGQPGDKLFTKTELDHAEVANNELIPEHVKVTF